MFARMAIYTSPRFVDDVLVLDVFRQRPVHGSNRSGAAHDSQGQDVKIVGHAPPRFPKQGFFLAKNVIAERMDRSFPALSNSTK